MKEELNHCCRNSRCTRLLMLMHVSVRMYELELDCMCEGSEVNPQGEASVQSQHSVCNESENQ